MDFRDGHKGGRSRDTGARYLSRHPFLYLIPLGLLAIFSSGCKIDEWNSRIEEREKSVAEAAAELEAKESLLAQREGDLRIWESELRSEADRLKAQHLAIQEQITLLEQRQKEHFDLKSAELRGPAPEIFGKRAIVIDAHSGDVLFEKLAHEPCHVASTQKLMTALLVAEAGDLDKLVTVEEGDTAVEPTKLYIKVGEQISRRTILNGLLVRSGNDLALCLARDCAGSVEGFAAKMNRRAAELGMHASHFINPHGLTEEGQQSTAHDMAKLARAAYHNPTIREIVSQKTFVFEHGDGTKKPLRNTNRILTSVEACDGMKTGYTVASGNCLVCSGSSGDLARIVVVLGSSGSNVWKDSQALLEWSLKG